MSTLATVFNPSNRPVRIAADGRMIGVQETREVDLSDPSCSLAISSGFLVVLSAPEPVVAASEVAVEVVDSSEQADPAPVLIEADVVTDESDDQAKSRKSRAQANKES